MRRLVALCLLLAATAKAAEVKLEWDQSTSPNLAGNRVYIGTSSRTYWTPITIPVQTTYTVAGLGPGTFYFAVTAFDADGNESDFSNEVSQAIAPAGISITSQACSANWYGVVCLATVSQKSSAIFRYQKVGLNGWATIVSTPTPTKTQHRAVVYFEQGLRDYYNYEWAVTDASGSTVIGHGTFRTK